MRQLHRKPQVPRVVPVGRAQGACVCARRYHPQAATAHAPPPTPSPPLPQRICDKCFGGGDNTGAGAPSGGGGEDGASSGEDDGGAADRMRQMKLGSGGGEESAPATGRAPTVKLPDVPLEEAVAALKDFPFEGRWQALLSFTLVDLKASGLDPMLQFKPVAGAALKRNTGGSARFEAGPLRAGGKARVFLDLETKGPAYFRGGCADFGQFGMDGKVTGALQRTLGRVNMTIQIINAKSITTSFNFVGLMNKAGVLSGTFSCVAGWARVGGSTRARTGATAASPSVPPPSPVGARFPKTRATWRARSSSCGPRQRRPRRPSRRRRKRNPR